MESAKVRRQRGHHRILDQRKTGTGKGLAKGAAFESCVIALFPKNIFSVLHNTQRVAKSGKPLPSVLHPDFRLLHKPSGHIFWVECKFRSSARYGVISWSTGASQFQRYKEFQEKVRPEKVYIVVGLIGSPSEPKFMYCISLDDTKSPDFYINEVNGYRRHTHSVFAYSQGRLR